MAIQNIALKNLLANSVSENLYLALIRQLNKDLMLANLEYSILEKVTPDVLIEQLTSIIADLINNDFNSFLNLLYRIDIPEYKIKELSKINQEVYMNSISFFVLERVWKKVWFKKNYG